ncbi:MAG: DUF362 domain-containing protein [Methanomicrobiales archaeon]|nr:DUF362 domain-containing protein [Methanomicrobiales archaeon]
MKSDVFFADIRAKGEGENTGSKIERLFNRAGFGDLIGKGDITAIKMHFGEMGGDSFVSPLHVRHVVDLVRGAGGIPFLTDTGTLYRGSRSNAATHLETAIRHGFDYVVVGAPVIIADGLRGSNWREVPVKGKHFERVRIAADILDASCMMVISHFKGHMLAGFGGALKNLAMGCAPPAGKREQHTAKAFVHAERCLGCGMCVEFCPAGAAVLDGGVCRIDRTRCLGCGDCMRACRENAIEFDWDVEIDPFLERMVEYACGAMTGKEGRVGFLNFLLNITPDCDCVPWSDASIVPNIGILASRDPVALDHASYDLVNSSRGIGGTALLSGLSEGEDKFRGMWPHTNGLHQIEYAEEMRLGSASYRLIEV